MTDFSKLLERAADLLLPELENPDDPRSLEREFSKHAKSAAQVLGELNELIVKNEEYIMRLSSDKTSWDELVPAILLCGEHSCQNPWVSKDSLEASASLWRTLNFNLSRGIKEAFTVQVSGLVFNALRPKLGKETFAASPAAVTVFTWLLFQHKHPGLSDVLHLVIPTTLILVDDFRHENRLIGLRCLRHVIQESDSAELLRFGRAELFFDALKPLQYQQDPDLVEAFYPVLFTCLEIMHPYPEDSSTWMSISPWDEAISILLNNLNLVQSNEQKLVYLDVLEDVLSRVQARFTRFSTPALRILEEFLDIHVGNEELQLKCLQVLEVILHYCWPCAKNHDSMFWLLVKFTHDIVSTKLDTWVNFRLPVKRCVSKFAKSAELVVDRFRHDLKARGGEVDKPLIEAFNFLLLN